MSAIKPHNSLRSAIESALRRHCFPALAFAEFSGCDNARRLTRAGLAAALLQTPAAGAVTLGALEYESAIGEPFRATTTATIRNGEGLQPGCITTSPYKLGTLRLREPLEIKTPGAQQPGQYTIELTTRKALTEPMYELQLRVDCPGTAALTRSYIVMLDAPRGSGTISADASKLAQAPGVLTQRPAAAAAPRSIPTLTQPVARPASNSAATTGTSAAESRPLARRPGSGKSVNPGEPYTVAKGDTLFGIAARLNERPAGTTWAAARMLFDANPDAFLNGDKNQLKLGAVLRIPDSAIVASLQPEAEFDSPTAPSTPGPERQSPARPALVRSEESTRTNPEKSSAAAASDAPLPFALQPAAIAAASAGESRATVRPSPAPTAKSASTTAQTETTTRVNAERPTISYPTAEPVSPLLAGLVGMLLGALFATLLFSARRIFDSLRRDAWQEAEATAQFNAFDTTATLDAYEQSLPKGQAAKAAGPKPAEAGTAFDAQAEQDFPSVELPRMKTDEYPVSPFGTIEVEFSELDALAGKTLGFNLSEVLADTAEQPRLGESPRINLEGLGTSFDLNRELEEMLEEFGPEAIDHQNIDLSGGHADTDVDVDIEDSGEVTQPRFDELADSDGIFSSSQTMLSEDTSNDAEATRTLAMKPLSLGLDLDLGLNTPHEADDDLDFSFDTEELPGKSRDAD